MEETNIYEKLNNIIEYIENNLEEDIDFKILARMIGVNEYTFQKLFAVLCNISLTEYIRNRRLSNAGQEIYLNNVNIIDIALKYKYMNPASFSRAFEKFHGIKPSEARRENKNLRIFTKIHFNEEYKYTNSIEYEIIEKEELILYGKFIDTTTEKISKDAPAFYQTMLRKFGIIEFGMTEYSDKDRFNVVKYWILNKSKQQGFIKKIIPKSKWILIRTNSQNPKEIQKNINSFYESFLPSSKIALRDLPELEYYHDEITDLLFSIEK